MAWRGLSKNIKELRFLFCQTSPSSSSTRSFMEKNYKELKTVNPKLPILIREAKGTEPQLWAIYDFGVEKGIRLEGMNEEQISKALQGLAKDRNCFECVDERACGGSENLETDIKGFASSKEVGLVSF